jgi:hypothetical protein
VRLAAALAFSNPKTQATHEQICRLQPVHPFAPAFMRGDPFIQQTDSRLQPDFHQL